MSSTDLFATVWRVRNKKSNQPGIYPLQATCKTLGRSKAIRARLGAMLASHRQPCSYCNWEDSQ
jgi:hypothetical protein